MPFVVAMQMWKKYLSNKIATIRNIVFRWFKKIMRLIGHNVFCYFLAHFISLRVRRIHANTLTATQPTQWVEQNAKTVREENQSTNWNLNAASELMFALKRKPHNGIAKEHLDNRLFSTNNFNAIDRRTGVAVWWWD